MMTVSRQYQQTILVKIGSSILLYSNRAIWIRESLSKSQYNYFIEGKQVSFLNEVLPNIYSINPQNTQSIGSGIDLTIRSKLNNKWSSYGFYRWWSIEESDFISCSPLIYCMEPKNQTHEIGAGISYHF